MWRECLLRLEGSDALFRFVLGRKGEVGGVNEWCCEDWIAAVGMLFFVSCVE